MLCYAMLCLYIYSKHLWILEIFGDQVGLPEGQLSVFIISGGVWNVLLQLHAPVSSFQNRCFFVRKMFLWSLGYPNFQKKPRVSVFWASIN